MSDYKHLVPELDTPAALAGGPLDSTTKHTHGEVPGPLRYGVAGKGVAQYKRTEREDEQGRTVFEFDGYEKIERWPAYNLNAK